MADGGVEPGDVDLCESCRAQAIAVAAAHIHRFVVTFMCVGGAKLPWTCIVRSGHDIKAMATGHTQEDALFDALCSAGVLR